MKIAIVGKSTGTFSFGINKAYLNFAKNVGKKLDEDNPPVISVLFPYSKVVDTTIDLLILPGGPDVLDSSIEPSIYSTQPDVYLEWFDRANLRDYIAAGIPIFGICRGFQALNIVFGGTLHQELNNHPYTEDKEGRAGKAHDVIFTNEFLNLREAQGTKQRKEVNSLHHQGIRSIGRELMPLAYAENKKWRVQKLVEAFMHERLPIAGVQWHPEEYTDQAAIAIIEKIYNMRRDITTDRLETILADYEFGE